MDAVVVAKQEKAVDVSSLLQLKQGRNRSMWMNLLAMQVAVAGMGYTMVAVDTGLDY